MCSDKMVLVPSYKLLVVEEWAWFSGRVFIYAIYSYDVSANPVHVYLYR